MNVSLNALVALASLSHDKVELRGTADVALLLVELPKVKEPIDDDRWMSVLMVR